MSLNEETTLGFENYLEDTLSKEERDAFELKLKQDPDFATDFKTYKEIGDVLQHQFSEERIAFKTDLEKTSDAFFASEIAAEETEEQTKVETKVVKFRPWKYSMAASILLLFGFFLFQQLGSPKIDDYGFNESISLTQRSGEDAVLKKAETSFNNKSYKEAITHFDALLANDADNIELQFYKALSHDALLQFDEADALFGRIAVGNSVYKYKATYYAAISQWRRDNEDAAKELLKTIPESAAEYDNAEKLLSKL